MKTHKYTPDTSVLFTYAFPVLDNEFDAELDAVPNRFFFDQDSMLLREGLAHDNDNFNPLE